MASISSGGHSSLNLRAFNPPSGESSQPKEDQSVGGVAGSVLSGPKHNSKKRRCFFSCLCLGGDVSKEEPYSRVEKTSSTVSGVAIPMLSPTGEGASPEEAPIEESPVSEVLIHPPKEEEVLLPGPEGRLEPSAPPLEKIPSAPSPQTPHQDWILGRSNSSLLEDLEGAFKKSLYQDRIGSGMQGLLKDYFGGRNCEDDDDLQTDAGPSADSALSSCFERTALSLTITLLDWVLDSLRESYEGNEKRFPRKDLNSLAQRRTVCVNLAAITQGIGLTEKLKELCTLTGRSLDSSLIGSLEEELKDVVVALLTLMSDGKDIFSCYLDFPRGLVIVLL